jgi:hypothetical protein
MTDTIETKIHNLELATDKNFKRDIYSISSLTYTGYGRTTETAAQLFSANSLDKL